MIDAHNGTPARDAQIAALMAEPAKLLGSASLATPTLTCASSALMTPGEVAALLRINTRTLRRLVHMREFPRPIVLGSARRWSRATVEQWIREQQP